MDKPDPKDPKYKDRVNLFCKDMRRWESTQYRPVEPLPDDDLDARLAESFKGVEELTDFLRLPPGFVDDLDSATDGPTS